MEYPSIQNLYARDPEDPKLVGPEYGFKVPAVEQISKWLVLEKVDGMNMRVVFEPANVRIFGRSDRANVPNDLRHSIESWATADNFILAFDTTPGDVPTLPAQVILFGEGYGAGIQKGSHYRPDKGFILFDVLVDGHWLEWVNVVDVAHKLGIETVPVICRSCSRADVEFVVQERMSQLLENGHEAVEGVIARTDPYLFDGRGRRVMFKYKVRDL